jgi:serine/threonine protein kinase
MKLLFERKLPPPPTEEQWLTADHYLEGKANGTKLPCSMKPKRKKLYNAINDQQLAQTKHAFIILEEEKYAVVPGEDIVGKGGEGIVRWAYNRNNELCCIKLQAYGQRGEASIAADLRQSKGFASLIYEESFYETPPKPKTAMHQLYLGISFFNLLQPNLKLSDQIRLRLSIKLGLAWIKLAIKGSSSITRTKRAHLDLKPPNIVLDKFGNVHVVDYGMAEPNPNEPPLILCGTPGYLPSFDTMDSSFQPLNKIQYDRLAFLRILWMPKSLYTVFQGNLSGFVTNLSHEQYPSLLSKSILNEHGLKKYIDTGSEEIEYNDHAHDDISIIAITAMLINAELNLGFKPEDLINDADTALFIITMYELLEPDLSNTNLGKIRETIINTSKNQKEMPRILQIGKSSLPTELAKILLLEIADDNLGTMINILEQLPEQTKINILQKSQKGQTNLLKDCIAKRMQLNTFINSFKYADFSFLEEETHHTGLREIQKIANSSQEDSIKFQSIYETVYERVHGWMGGRDYLSKLKFPGNGRNPIVGHLYATILDIGANASPDKINLTTINFERFDEILRLPALPAEISKISKNDIIISQCFRETKRAIFKDVATNLGQYGGIQLLPTGPKTDFSKVWTNITSQAHSSIKSNILDFSYKHKGFSLLDRALSQYSANITKYPLSITGAYSLLIGQQKREAIELLNKHLEELENGILRFNASDITNTRITAIKHIISELEKDDNNDSVNTILNRLLGNPAIKNGLEKNRTSETSVTKTSKLVTKLSNWDNLEDFKFLNNPKPTMQGCISHLKLYKDQRKMECDTLFSFFSGNYAYSKKIKIEAANKLATLLEESELRPQFNPEDLDALSDGRLGMIFKKIQKDFPGIVDIKNMVNTNTPQVI